MVLHGRGDIRGRVGGPKERQVVESYSPGARMSLLASAALPACRLLRQGKMYQESNQCLMCPFSMWSQDDKTLREHGKELK